MSFRSFPDAPVVPVIRFMMVMPQNAWLLLLMLLAAPWSADEPPAPLVLVETGPLLLRPAVHTAAQTPNEEPTPTAEPTPPEEPTPSAEPLTVKKQLPMATAAPEPADPSLQSLNAELEKLRQEQTSLKLLLDSAPSSGSKSGSTATESHRLRMQLDQLLQDLRKGKRQKAAAQKSSRSESPAKPSGPAPIVSPLTTTQTPSAPDSLSPSTSSQPSDPVALGHVLLRMGDHEGAARSFRGVELNKLRAVDRAYVQYMLATSLRMGGNLQEALPLYREVANSRADLNLAEIAQWQLALIGWRQELENQLEHLRQRRKSLDSDAPSQSADAINNMPADATESMPASEAEVVP